MIVSTIKKKITHHSQVVYFKKQKETKEPFVTAGECTPDLPFIFKEK